MPESSAVKAGRVVDGAGTLGQSPPASAPARSARTDVLSLLIVVVCSSAPYLQGLGFYSDDWALIGVYKTAIDQSLPGLMEAGWSQLNYRPVLSPYFAALYWLFGMNTLPYHICNHAVFAASILLLYRCLRLFSVPRPLSFTAPLIFACLPNYSTDRLWFVAFQANLSLLFYAVSFYSDLRAAAGARPGWAMWKTVSTAAMLASLLAYEVIAPLFWINLLLIQYKLRLAGEPSSRRAALLRERLSPLLTLAVFVLTLAYKLQVTDRAIIRGSYWSHLQRLASGAFSTHYVSYGLELPAKALRAWSQYTDAGLAVLAGLLATFVAVYLFRISGRNFEDVVGPGAWLTSTVAGVVLTLAGYTAFLGSDHVGFSDTGIDNRTAYAASLGVALAFSGTIGLACSVVRPERLRRAVFSLTVALVCAAGLLINSAIARFWIEANHRQHAIISALRKRVPSIPPDSTLILDGICPYIGPGIVFETGWDVGGMLMVLYNDASLSGDVVTHKMKAGPEGLTTSIYEEQLHYPYTDKLFVYHAGRDHMQRLSSRDEAESYFSQSRRLNQCPAGREGLGVRIF